MEDLVRELIQRRSQTCFPLGLHKVSRDIANRVLGILFPHFAQTFRCDEPEIAAELAQLESSLVGFAAAIADKMAVPDSSQARVFLKRLPQIYQALSLDARAIHFGDPAAKSIDEVILTYPGFFGIAVHRIAHELYLLDFPLLPRLLAEYAHERTGIDIHPGATIGRSFFIDHGTGVVIGETATIGNGVKIYQGVTLGALAVQKDLAGIKRHPTLEDNVVVYANATILGGSTIIGHDSVVGGNAWVTREVPAFSVVGQNAEIRPRRSGDSEVDFVI